MQIWLKGVSQNSVFKNFHRFWESSKTSVKTKTFHLWGASKRRSERIVIIYVDFSVKSALLRSFKWSKVRQMLLPDVYAQSGAILYSPKPFNAKTPVIKTMRHLETRGPVVLSTLIWHLVLVYILMLLYMYIAPGQRQTTPWGQMLMSTESPHHFAHLLQVLKQPLHVFSCCATCI